jgi:O-antigen ligase
MSAPSARIPLPRRSPSEPSQVLPIVWVCAPSLLLAWSGYGAWISEDPLPHLSGFALASLLGLFASLWTLARGREPALLPSALLLCAVLCGAGSVAAGRVTDALEAQRSWCAASMGFALLAAGGSLRPGARANLGRALPLLSLAFTLPALGAHVLGSERGLAGSLGNTGALSLAALPGAAAGAWLALRRPGPWRWVGLSAAAAFAAHAWLAPVLAGTLTFGVLLLVFAFTPSAGPTTRTTRWPPLVSALALLAGAFLSTRGAAPLATPASIATPTPSATPASLVTPMPSDTPASSSAPTPSDTPTSSSAPTPSDTPTSSSARASSAATASSAAPALSTETRAAGSGTGAASASADAGNLGGLGVRLRLWRTFPRIVAREPLYGLGPGQFQAAYPPLRDPQELEASTHGRASTDFSEVEHLHNDWLQGIAEWGLLGGTAWILLLLAGGSAGWKALRGADPTRAIAASALLPLLLGAALHAPFTYVPAASAQGFVLLGLVLGSASEVERPRWQRVALRALPLAFGLLALPASLALLEHGRAITNRGALAAWAQRMPDVDLVEARAEERTYIDRALTAVPRSAVAHALLARYAAQDPALLAQELEQWRLVLAERPYSAEALFRCGLLEAAAGRSEPAREYWQRLLSIDADEPSTLRNLALLEARAGRAGEATRHFDRLESAQRLSVDWLRTTAARELLSGRLEAGLLFAMRAEGWSKRPLAEELDARGLARAKVSADLYAEALRAAAQWLWGREQFAYGQSADAVRNFRQALTATRRVLATGAPALRAELAVALDAAGRAADARAELGGLRLDAELLQLLPGPVAARAPQLVSGP